MIKQALISTLFLLGLVSSASAGPTTLDVSTFTAPSGWARAERDLSDEYTVASKTGAGSIMIMRSLSNGTNARGNFDKAWATFVTPTFPDATPTLAPASTLDGWQLVRGTATYTFQGNPARTTVLAATRGPTYVIVLATTVGPSYVKDVDKFFASLRFAATPAATPSTTPPPTTQTSTTLSGAWGFSSGGAMGPGAYAAWLSDRREYTFDGNGNYTFLRRYNLSSDRDTSLIRERGTYTLDGDVLTLTPTKSEREIWNKVPSGPNAGAYEKLLRREKVALEKTAYRVAFTVYLDTKVPNLMLTPSAATTRDGRFNASTQYRLFHPDNSYYTAIPPTP